MNYSKAQLLALLPESEQKKFWTKLNNQQAIALQFDWDFWARPSQQIPGKLPNGMDWFTWLLLSGRGYGKALSLDTLVPTASGWSTMGDLQIGETVFDENGQQCNVTFISDIMYDHICYDVVFSDGTIITADANHEWLTWTHAARKAHGRAENPTIHPTVRTTQEIKNTLFQGKRNDINHSIDCSPGLVCDYQKLPIPPYVLGVWLGDGSCSGAEITCINTDYQIMEEIEKQGIPIKKINQIDPLKADRYNIGFAEHKRDKVTGRMLPNGSFHSMLKDLNLYKNKHIPEIYLRSSYNQRLELLQGLMDTDGHVIKKGTCEFCSISKTLAKNVYELCISLGIKAVIIEGNATINGKFISKKYRVNFTPYIPVFKLKRKLERVHAPGKQSERQKRRYIVEISKRESVPVRCIQVDSESHLFLASKSMIPTHNSRTGAETVIQWASEGYSPIALVGQTKADVRDTMVEVGDSSILKVSPPWFYPDYEPSKRRLTFPNGSVCIFYSGDEPDQLRGPNHQKAWVDELAKYKKARETWDNLEMSLRKGDNPQVICTTTPRPIKLIKDIVKDNRTVVTRGNTTENAANLNPLFLNRMLEKYGGTRQGRQELNGDILDDNPNALWKMEWIDEPFRVAIPPKLDRVVVGVDPAVTSNPNSADTGIIVAGLQKYGALDIKTGRSVPHYYILGDYTIHGTPNQWAIETISAFKKHLADKVIGEVNNGGDLVESNIRSVDPNIAYKAVHAARGKDARAEPVSSLYEQGRVHHVGFFPLLEEEQTDWVPGEGPSPNRIDAEVWAIWYLMQISTEKEQDYDTYQDYGYISEGIRI